MPRVEALGKNIDKFCRETGDGSSTYDVCRDCHNDLVNDPHCYDDELGVYNGEPDEPEDGWGGEVEHPDYVDEDYRCAVCNELLTEEDD